ncbi:hypothetical protein LAZ67_1003984 [Cordylochernes scorpioides]|uniref:Uncharacterized protein n=1 Tax=Cordylochernes scorpioides TaxID=51811 RepID=A0ABY6JYW8_9ARAC|nr:hypothetical protein LAZ67_1003984 [Cordylochernes scorpioides]
MADQPVSSAELKKLRTPVRAMFTKAFNELETEIKKKEVKKADVEKILRRLQTHHEKLLILNMRMEEALLRESASEDIFTAEYESVCEYEDNFSNIMTDYEALAKKDDDSTISGTAAMNYRLPKLEFKKFGGEPREWITFWSQFSTIDRDPQMPPETKFQYLFQATAENSEAREAVESFPPSADNYPKVIEYIKSRFGEDEMLVEIYVRDLLQNVLQNVRAEGKMSVVKLYDRLETQLRALETLGVARDKFAAMLYPLVESALPEDTLRVWERSQHTVSGRGVQDKLTQLMTFLKTEVKGESRVNMAKAAFKIDNNQDVKDDRSNRKSLSKKNTGSKMPTATDLANTTQMRNNCIFCGKGHPSQECYSGQRMHLPEKKDRAKGKNVCFWCLLPGHGFKKCRIKPRCPVCGGKHYPIMCPTLEAQKTSHLQKAELKASRESPATEQETANQLTSTTVNNATVGGVYLQTLIVKISGPKGRHNVRVLLDCGSQRSYISKRMVDALGLKRVQQVTLTHNLFGGGEIRQKKHNVYKVNVSSLNSEYMDDLKFLDQEVICGHISQVRDDTILNELKARGINLTDICQGEEISIHMLIGSDLLSGILTGRMQILQSGVVATETKLGWTVMGPAIGKDMEDSCLIVTSLHVNSFVSNRVKEITTPTKSEDWNHVAGEHNPADLPSRGESPSKFTKSGWWEGPKWLQEKKEDWPVSKVQYDLEAIEEERRKTVVTGFVAKKPEENPWYLNLYEGKREVTLPQILRVIAWMLRFKPSEYKGDIISQEELDSAEKSLVKIIQSESIGEEDPKMKQLHAFQDKEGLWRVKTRIVNDDELFRLPILIPTNHPVTELIVKSVHEKIYHCGAQTLRSVLREKLWIPKARQLVRHVIHKCPRCRRFETKRVDVPEASLPQHRVRDVVVFEVTGIDLGGPLYLEDGQKVCHYSDNGTNLVGLRNELYRVNFGVKWKLNPPAAPWWGGWIERIVGLSKKLLRGLLGKRVVNYEEMVTILGNCERVINARPLTYIAEDNDDLVPLTPEMFLREPRTEGEIDLNEFRCNFGKSYEKRKRLLKEFRKRFRSEYLGLLVHHDNRRKQRQLKVGDIVLVEVENRKQINWPMGKITRVFPGTDNVRRLVEVKTKSGFMKRAVQRLFPLEVPSEDVEQGDRELKPAEDEIVREKTPDLRKDNNSLDIIHRGRKIGNVHPNILEQCFDKLLKKHRSALEELQLLRVEKRNLEEMILSPTTLQYGIERGVAAALLESLKLAEVEVCPPNDVSPVLPRRETPRNEKTEEPARARAGSYCPEVEGDLVQIPTRDEKAVQPSPPKQPVHTRNSEMAKKIRKRKKKKRDPSRATPTEEVKEPPPPKKIRAKEVKDPPKAAKTTKPEPETQDKKLAVAAIERESALRLGGLKRARRELILSGINSEIKEEALREMVVLKNSGCGDFLEGYMRLYPKSTRRPYATNWVISGLKEATMKSLLGKKRCLRPGHIARTCEHPKRCGRCEGVHSQEQGCDMKPGCWLCLEDNKRYSRTYDSNHRPRSTQCSVKAWMAVAMVEGPNKEVWRFMQLNCARSRRSSEELDQIIKSDRSHVILVQEMYLEDDGRMDRGPEGDPGPHSDRHFENEEPEDEISLTTCGLVDPPFSENEVKLTAFKFGNRKYPGPDGIDNTVVKALVRCRLFNRCLDTGTFPETWKVAQVVLLEKSGRKGNSPNDYRPLSLLACLGKVLDSLLTQRLKHWLESNQLLSSFQHGYREGKSTTTALNEVLEGVEMGLNKGAWVLHVALDIYGAFNSMSWNKLMRNLMDMGCPDNLCSLVRDFLRDRRISLSFGGRKLERNCARGCPRALAADLFCGISWDIRTERKEIKWEHKPAIRMEGRRVALVNRMTILGVVIDDKMGWQYQAEEMVARGREALCRPVLGNIALPAVRPYWAGLIPLGLKLEDETIRQKMWENREDALGLEADALEWKRDPRKPPHGCQSGIGVLEGRQGLVRRFSLMGGSPQSVCREELQPGPPLLRLYVAINLEKGQLAHQIIQELDMMTRAPELPWFKEHSLIEGNEFADRLSKAGCFRGRSLRTLVTKKEVYRRIRAYERDVDARHYVLDCPRVVGVQEREKRGARGAIESKLLRNHSKLLGKAHDVAAELFLSYGTRTYRTCNNCPGAELTPTHIFSYPAMVAALQKFDIDPEQQLYTPKIVDIAAAVMEIHGDI